MIICAVTVATILLFTVVQEVKGSPAPKKGKGGGSKGGGGRSSGGSKGGGGYKKSGGGGLKSFGKKHWKKAAAFGAGAYVASKLTPKFPTFGMNGVRGSDWGDWAEADGFLCRKNSDCTWADPTLFCQDYEFNINLVQAAWGNWKADLIGECSCQPGNYFDRYNLSCQPVGIATWLIAVIIIVILLIAVCCCCGICWFIKR